MDLKADDYVGVTFWIISAAMVAATYFFTVERDRAVGKWKTSLTVAAMVTGIAAIHYFYMRGVWVNTGESPLVFRYVDWLLTVPLQIIEFYLILAAIAVVRAALFWKLMIASLVMLVFGFLGELGAMSYWPAFAIGMAGWLYIIYEIFAGEASQISAANGHSGKPDGVQRVTSDRDRWLGYLSNRLHSWCRWGGAAGLNLIYNLADFVNKIAFGVVIWVAATSSSENA